MAEQHHQISGLGITFTFIAGVLLIGSGLIIAMYGFIALTSDVGHSTNVGLYIGPGAWGVIQIVGGAVLFFAGCNLFVGKYWARLVGIGVAVIALIGGLVSIDAYPVWGVVLVVLNLFILWALMFHATDASFD
jgi:hypothetical protein